MQRGPLVEINIACLKHNFDTIGRLTGKVPVLAVVKADAYGHGAVRIATLLEEMKVHAFSVAFNSEAVELREAGIKKPILVFFDPPDIDEILSYDLTPVLVNERAAGELSALSLKRGKRVKVHVTIDTGMGRLGFLSLRDVNALREVAALKGIQVTGVMSHFSEADLLDRTFAELQLKRFLEVRKELFPLFGGCLWHMSNSAAVLSYPDAHLDMVRPGLMLYGCDPFKRKNSSLLPVMTVRCKILEVRKVPTGTSVSYGRTFVTRRDSLIGVIGLGYSDGYPRALSNKGRVIVNGQVAPIVGRICMDLTMVDLTDITGLTNEYLWRPYNCIILGKEGDVEITADELAAYADTISYEILTSLGRSKHKCVTNVSSAASAVTS
ncbi:MAG: alanine racemase [Nitrospirae bacterium]|nr:alanine racemase [Nitrospirota bacterium]